MTGNGNMEADVHAMRELFDELTDRPARIHIDELSVADVDASKKVWQYLTYSLGPVSDIVVQCWPGPGPAPIHSAYPKMLDLLRMVLEEKG